MLQSQPPISGSAGSFLLDFRAKVAHGVATLPGVHFPDHDRRLVFSARRCSMRGRPTSPILRDMKRESTRFASSSATARPGDGHLGLRGRHERSAGRGWQAAGDDYARARMVADIKRELQSEMGLLPLQLLRERRSSFVELYTADNFGKTNYGTAGYLGGGYFVTVKHAVVALNDGDDGESRAPDRVDQGAAPGQGGSRPSWLTRATPKSEVHSGDWAIIKTKELDLPALRPDTGVCVRLRRADLPAGQRLFQRHHPVDRLRRTADSERARDVPHRRPSGRLGRRRPRTSAATSSASRSAGCRATIASRSSCRCAPRCSARSRVIGAAVGNAAERPSDPSMALAAPAATEAQYVLWLRPSGGRSRHQRRESFAGTRGLRAFAASRLHSPPRGCAAHEGVPVLQGSRGGGRHQVPRVRERDRVSPAGSTPAHAGGFRAANQPASRRLISFSKPRSAGS